MLTAVYKQISLLESDLHNGRFGSNHYLIESPRDGHCLVHSVLAGLRNLGMSLKLDDILKAIKIDTVDNADT